MRLLFLVLMLFTLSTSCGSQKKLLEATTTDGEKVIIKKGLFSGIEYLYVEKKMRNKLKTYMFDDCACGISNKIALRKGVISDEGVRSLWTAVTDTVGQPRFFDDVIAPDRLIQPVEFMSASDNEMLLLQEGINKSNKECCKNPAKPIKSIIGFLRVKLN